MKTKIQFLIPLLLCLGLFSCEEGDIVTGGEGDNNTRKEVGASGEGTIIGNAGSDIALNFTSLSIRTFVHYSNIFENYENSLKAYNENLSYWKRCLLVHSQYYCGPEPKEPTPPTFETDLITKSFLIEFERALQATKVIPTASTLCPKENPTCSFEESAVAINHPDQNLIYVNQTKWNRLEPETRVKISLHEYLGIMKIEDSQYFYSSVIAPVIYYQYVHVDFTVDKLKNFLDKINLKVTSFPYSLSHIKQKGFILNLFDCLHLVHVRFPHKTFLIEEITMSRDYETEKIFVDNRDGEFFINDKATLQTCYNVLITTGLN